MSMIQRQQSPPAVLCCSPNLKHEEGERCQIHFQDRSTSANYEKPIRSYVELSSKEFGLRKKEEIKLELDEPIVTGGSIKASIDELR
ncbi:hypothetical protein V1478_012475 [Vespula squamosa]|uniref:Uncharacterized protein n=1 Tax=Vespula squamosa TaxID=30214 RepID=A0ABD2AD97_VESSQ